jgi:hypothetical protein
LLTLQHLLLLLLLLLLLHNLDDLLLLDACIPLLDEGLELRELCIAIDQALGDDRLSPADSIECILTHISFADMTEYLVRERLALISRDMDEVAIEPARASLSVVIILARYSAFVIDMDELRRLCKLSLDIVDGFGDQFSQALEVRLMRQTHRNK